MTKCRYKVIRQSSPVGRVVYRSNNNANANGGVSYANANNDSSNTNANIGSRLNNLNRQAVPCLPFNRPTPLLDVSLHGVPRGMRLTNSGNFAGKVKKQDNWVEFGRCLLAVEEVGPKRRKAMKRDSHVMEEVLSYSNISEAIDEVLSGTERKKTSEGRYILEHREEVINQLQKELGNGTFELGPWTEREIKEAGKIRHLQIFPQIKRIGINAVMRVVDTHLRRRFIRTTGASIKGRGMHDLMKYIRDDMKRDPDGTRFAYKFDIRKFYENISQEEVKHCVRRVFKDPVLIQLLDTFISLISHGLSLGLRSSQGLANLMLSMVLDHYLKDEEGVEYYYRYCDDGLILSGDKMTLWKCRDTVKERLATVGLEIKPNERVFPVSEGIDFLGYVIYSGDHVELRKRIKKRMARKMAEVKSRKRRDVLTASFYGMAKHANCINLFQTLTGKDMKSFKDLGVSYAPADGKKRFPGPSISIRELVNLPIVVKDFETGIKTDQGENRTLVAIEQNGEPKKFFTASVEMKNILEQIRDVPDGFPFETTIKAESFGKGKTKYVFS